MPLGAKTGFQEIAWLCSWQFLKTRVGWLYKLSCHCILNKNESHSVNGNDKPYVRARRKQERDPTVPFLVTSGRINLVHFSDFADSVAGTLKPSGHLGWGSRSLQSNGPSDGSAKPQSAFSSRRCRRAHQVVKCTECCLGTVAGSNDDLLERHCRRITGCKHAWHRRLSFCIDHNLAML
jgi:hypothetical protein